MYFADKAARCTDDNAISKTIYTCGMCYVNSFGKACDSANVYSYAYMAVAGESFFGAGWNCCLLEVKRLLKFSFSRFIAACFMFIGKIGVTVFNCFSLVLIMKHITDDDEEVSSFAGPVIIVAVVTYCTASVILGLFDTTIQAMMVCLGIDTDLHDGTPKYGTATFHNSLSEISKDKNF